MNTSHQTYKGPPIIHCESRNFKSSDLKDSIYYNRLYINKGPKIRPILILHDICEHHRYYRALAEYLLVQGQGRYQIYLMDWRGHGQSTGSRSHLASGEELESDFIKIIQEISKLTSNKISLLANGVAALPVLKSLSLNQVVASRVCDVVFSSPLFSLNSHLKMNYLTQSRWSHGTLGKVRIPWHLKGSFWTNEKAYQLQIDGDPLFNGHVSIGTMAGLQKQQEEIYPYLYFFDRPCFFMLGAEDKIIDVHKSSLLAKSIPGHLSEVRIYRDAGHGLFHEKIKDKTWRDLYNWFER